MPSSRASAEVERVHSVTRPAARCSTPCHKDAEEGGTRPGCPTRHLLAHARALRTDWTKRSKRNVGRKTSRPWRPAVRRGSPTAPWFRCNVRVRDRAGTCADGATSFILVTRLWGVCAGGWRRKFGCRKPPASAAFTFCFRTSQSITLDCSPRARAKHNSNIAEAKHGRSSPAVGHCSASRHERPRERQRNSNRPARRGCSHAIRRTAAGM